MTTKNLPHKSLLLTGGGGPRRRKMMLKKYDKCWMCNIIALCFLSFKSSSSSFYTLLIMPKQLIVQFTPIRSCLVNLPGQWVSALLDQRKVKQRNINYNILYYYLLARIDKKSWKLKKLTIQLCIYIATTKCYLRS